MAKTFEDYFSEYQTDMISIGMEYADYRKEVETLFIYASWENGWCGCNFFFKVNGQIVSKAAKMNEALRVGEPPFDVSGQRQKAAGGIVLEDLKKIHALCEEYGREMPTEIKIIYDAKTNKVDANYRYDLVRTKDPEAAKSCGRASEEWMAEEAAKLGQVIKLHYK